MSLKHLLPLCLMAVVLGTPAVQAQEASWVSFDEYVKDYDASGKGADNCSRCRWLHLEVEAVFLAPLLKDRPIDATITDVGLGTTVTQSSSAGSAEYFNVTPRITLGVQSVNGWGVVGRFWQMNNTAFGTDVLDITDPTDLTGFQSTSGFKAYTLDLEVTRELCYRNWELLATGGVRHASVERTEQLSSVGVVPLADVLSGVALSERQFNGTGLTFSVSGLRPMSHSCCLDWFWTARGSVLWGDNQTLSTSSMSVIAPGGAGFVSDGAAATSDDTMFIAELQGGVQWSREIETFNARTFARLAAEYQYWTADDGTSFSTATAGTAGVSSSTISATARRLDLSLIGFNLGAGFMW